MMTTAEFTNAEAAAARAERVWIVNGGRIVLRATQRLLGAALAIAAVGLWIAPGASWESDVMLFKLILSLMAFLAALGLLHASAPSKKPVVQIDTIRREVRVTRPAKEGSATVLERCAFADLSRADRLGNHIRLWGAENTLLADVTLTDRTALKSLIAGLQDTGKLA